MTYCRCTTSKPCMDTDPVPALPGGSAGTPNGSPVALLKAEAPGTLRIYPAASGAAPHHAPEGVPKGEEPFGMQHSPADVEPQSSEQPTCSLGVPITARDMAMLRSRRTGTAFGFSDRMDAQGDRCIDRRPDCICRLSLQPETSRHQAYCPAPDKFDVPGSAPAGMPSRGMLIQPLTRRMGHEEILKAVDLHSHIVPGVDDGAQDMTMALQMIQMEAEQGVRHIACTSHSFGMRHRGYRKRLAILQQALTQQGIRVTLYPGCEILCPAETPSSVLARVQSGAYALLGNSDAMLLEFDPDSGSQYILDFIRELLDLTRVSGSRAKHVVLAHAERYPGLACDKAALETLLAWGCRIQINAYSLAEEQKPDTKAFARRLLEEKKVSFLGSDAHHIHHRPPCMASGIRYVFDHCDVHYADAVCYENAFQLLTGAPAGEGNVHHDEPQGL